ncbi:tyrosine-type recombinase/integrase [Paraburkholderia solisilvae]|uniref:Prophage integrase IntS n=1 Tax=Paraburkholderia solisilvae TaxID=624376 RepID=A0A6J5DFN8_9BURK|nr:integrase arm-type DNA-binding domain-containing protein [Paraburkholderia solisilvae]CAB3753080.1 Prophage integrase IntS [Paraburkholderia solisilvae]
MPKLTELQIKNERPGEKPRKVYDEGGLFLLVNPNGSAYWRMRYVLGSKEKLIQLGVYRAAGSDTIKMRVGEARRERDAKRELLRQGVDPSADKRAATEKKRLEAEQSRVATAELREKRRAAAAAGKMAAVDAARTVRVVADEWLATYRAGWSVKHERQNVQSLRDHVYPIIGDLPIRNVGTAEIMSVLTPLLAAGKAETARRVRQRLGGVFQHAALREYIDRDPVPLVAKEFGKLRASALKVNPQRKFPCVPPDELPGLLRAMAGYTGVVVRLALRFTSMTLGRTTEVRGAKWTEFYELDGDAPIWRIPAERMKARRPHDIPLPRQACEVLRELRRYTGDDEYLFPHDRKRDMPMSENAMLYAIWSMGYRGRMTGHGFRALGSTILHEHGFRHEVIERALAHEQDDKVAAAYNRADYLDERRRMLQWYADRLDAIEAGKSTSVATPLRAAA